MIDLERNNTVMKRTILLLTVLFLSISVWSQELTSDKKYDFALILEESENENYRFTSTNFYTQLNKKPVLSFISYVEFPIKEEKETWEFGETKNEYSPVINLNQLNQSIPKFTNFSPYAKQHLDNAQGKMKILKGYDFCGRPLY